MTIKQLFYKKEENGTEKYIPRCHNYTYIGIGI